MKIAVYCRVNDQDQHPENQRLELVVYAKRMGYEYEVFEEEDLPRNSRPVKYALLKRLRAKEFDGLLVWRLDRWARNLREMILEVKELIDKNIAFISLKDKVDLSSEPGKAIFYLFSAFADFERETTRERIVSGLKKAKKEGKKLGRPFGARDREPRQRAGR